MEMNTWGFAGCGNGLALWRAVVKTKPRLSRGWGRRKMIWGQAAIYISFHAVKQLSVHSCVYFQNLSAIFICSFHLQYLSAPGDFLPMGNQPCRRRRGKSGAARVGSDGLRLLVQPPASCSAAVDCWDHRDSSWELPSLPRREIPVEPGTLAQRGGSSGVLGSGGHLQRPRRVEHWGGFPGYSVAYSLLV